MLQYAIDEIRIATMLFKSTSRCGECWYWAVGDEPLIVAFFCWNIRWNANVLESARKYRTVKGHQFGAAFPTEEGNTFADVTTTLEAIKNMRSLLLGLRYQQI